MFPYKTAFVLQRGIGIPLFLQLTNQFIAYIRDGRLPSLAKLPGSRTLAKELGVHRKVVVACYEELEAQGWVITKPKRGTYVQENLLVLLPPKSEVESSNYAQASYHFYRAEELTDDTNELQKSIMYVSDGSPDSRLAPTIELARIYRRIAGRQRVGQYLSYGGSLGSETLRTVLADYLNRTRGLSIQPNNILITRGSQMGIYLSALLLVTTNDHFMVGASNYNVANKVYRQNGANLITVPIDEKGVDTNFIAQCCMAQKVKGIYITPHHHYPSTVTLSAERRLHLLHLAQTHHMAIVEDDYDYDFNYGQAPILPLASYGGGSSVIYVGSICKTIAPAFRIGYLVAAEEVVAEAAKRRRYIDRQGDVLLELTIAEFIKTGGLERHIRKINKIYRARRDYLCQLLRAELGQYISFDIPKGGMAVWVRMKHPYKWSELTKYTKQFSLSIPEIYTIDSGEEEGMRIGFAAYTFVEIDELVRRLRASIDTMVSNSK